MGVGQAQGGFQGTQNFANNAIGAENYLLNGGAFNLANAPVNNSTTQPAGVGSIPSPFGNMGAMSPLSAGGNPSNATFNVQGQPSGANPYLQQYYNAAAQPMVQNYQNAVAPNLLANFASSGTVGGSGQTAAFNNAQSQLSQGLGSLGAQIYEPAWAQTQQIAANEAMQGQALQAQAGMQAQQNAANELMQQRGLAADLFSGAIGNTPALTANAYTPANEMAQAGAQQQNQLQNILNNAYGNLNTQAMWPYQALSSLGSGIAQMGGLGGGTQITTGSGMGGWK